MAVDDEPAGGAPADDDGDGFADLPFELPDGDSPVAYADLPDAMYDPDQDWRVAQLIYLRNQYGDYGPSEYGEYGPGDDDEEVATDG